jgi:hypothetical protein
MDPRFDDQAFGIYQQMALSAFDLLGGVEAALCASHSGGPDRLGVHDPCAGVRVLPAKATP